MNKLDIAEGKRNVMLYGIPFQEELSKIWIAIKRDKYLYLLLVPCVAYYILFAYRPMWGVQIAFKDYSPFKGIADSPWIGFKNFETFLTGPYFIRTLKNTLIINFYALVFSFPAPIIFALLLNEVKNNRVKRIVQTVSYLPFFVSIVVVAGIVTNFLAPASGIVNILIEKLGGEKIYFLTKPEYFRTIFTSMNLWKELGFNSIIYIAALSSIDAEQYEACIVDGGNRWVQLFHVTLPGIMPTIIIMLILKLGSLLEVNYESIILLYQPSTFETADVISSYVYRVGLQETKYGFASAVGLFNSVVALILVYLSNKISRKVSDASLW